MFFISVTTLVQSVGNGILQRQLNKRTLNGIHRLENRLSLGCHGLNILYVQCQSSIIFSSFIVWLFVVMHTPLNATITVESLYCPNHIDNCLYVLFCMYLNFLLVSFTYMYAILKRRNRISLALVSSPELYRCAAQRGKSGDETIQYRIRTTPPYKFGVSSHWHAYAAQNRSSMPRRKLVQHNHRIGYWRGKRGESRHFEALTNFGLQLLKFVAAPHPLPESYKGYTGKSTLLTLRKINLKLEKSCSH